MHVSEFTSADREVIRKLYAGEGWIDLYTLHAQYLLSPGQIADIMDRLARAGFVEVEGIRARMTGKGREWVIAARKIFLATDRSTWRPEADAMLQSELVAGQPYLPDPELVDRGFFVRMGMDNEWDSAKS